MKKRIEKVQNIINGYHEMSQLLVKGHKTHRKTNSAVGGSSESNGIANAGEERKDEESPSQIKQATYKKKQMSTFQMDVVHEVLSSESSCDSDDSNSRTTSEVDR